MKNLIKCGIFTLVVAGLFSCNKISPQSSVTVEERWTWPDSVENVLVIPDSIQERMASDSTYTMKDYLSVEQWEIYETLSKVIYHHQKVENDSTIFTMSRGEFLRLGIPEAYYDLILAEVKDYENYREKYGKDIFGDSLDIMWERAREEMRKEFPGIDK